MTPEPPMNNQPNSAELETLIATLGDICHEHYLGCSQNKAAPDGYEYAYDNEVVNLLDSPDTKGALASWRASTVVAELESLRAQVDHDGKARSISVAKLDAALARWKGQNDVK